MNERKRQMLIQVYIKSELLSQCDILIAKEDANLNIPVTSLAGLMENHVKIAIVKPQENIGMKAAVIIADAIKHAEAISSPVNILCPDKAIMDGICSMDYEGPAGGVIKCVPDGTKTASPRVRNLAKSGTAAKKSQPSQAKEPVETPAENNNGNNESPQNNTPMSELLQDPAFVKGDEVPVPEEAPESKTEKPDPSIQNAPKVMAILKECGVPSGQIPGVLEAIRASMDAKITLPMQVKLKLAKDGATDEKDPEATAKLVEPRFAELKTLLDEIDAANAQKAAAAGNTGT